MEKEQGGRYRDMGMWEIVEDGASWAVEKERNSICSRASAFSNTQRMEWSSSMIQTAFICVLLRYQ